MPVPAPMLVLIMLTGPVAVTTAFNVSVLPLIVIVEPFSAPPTVIAPLPPAVKVTAPAALIAFDRLIAPLLVTFIAPVNVSAAVVLTFPEFDTVKLLMLDG